MEIHKIVLDLSISDFENEEMGKLKLNQGDLVKICERLLFLP